MNSANVSTSKHRPINKIKVFKVAIDPDSEWKLKDILNGFEEVSYEPTGETRPNGYPVYIINCGALSQYDLEFLTDTINKLDIFFLRN